MSAWEYCNLEAAVKKATSNLSLNKIANEEGEYPVFGAKGFVSNISYYHQEEEYLAIIKDGAGIGRVSKHPGKSSILATMQYLVPNEAFDIDFIKYFLMSVDFQEYRTGSTIPHIYFKDYKSLRLPDIPIPEQQLIVSILDQAFADIEKARANAEKNLKNARELFDSYLNRAFDKNKTNWPIMNLGQIAEVKGGKRLPKGYKPTIEKTKYPYVRVADFDNKGSVNLAGMRYISEDVHNKIKRYTISSKDVFITIVGATIGKSGIVPKELDGANLTENACKLVLGSSMSNKFIYYFTITKMFYEQVGLNTRTAAQPKLALERLKTINLAIPPMDVQETLAAQFNTVWLETQELDMIYQRKVATLDELKKSLLEKAFSGELTKTEGHAA